MAPRSGIAAVCGFAGCWACRVQASRATAKILKTELARKSIVPMLQEIGRAERLQMTSLLPAVYAAIPRGTGCAQWAQRFASIGISLRHSGHFLVVGSAGAGAFRMRAIRRFTGVTTKKYTAAATSTKETPALTKSPRANMLPLMVNLMAEKSGLPTIAAISGVSRSLVKADTTEANAAPMTTPTAMSITLPRRMNCLNPLSMDLPSFGHGGHSTANHRRRQGQWKTGVRARLTRQS